MHHISSYSHLQKCSVSEDSGHPFHSRMPLSDYQEVRAIGKGAYGEVMLVTNKKEKKQVFICSHSHFSLRFPRFL